MIYDQQLGKWLDHDHEEFNDSEIRQAIAGIEKIINSHLKDGDNPHKVTHSHIGSEKPLFNASMLQGVPVDLEFKKHGWALAYNKNSDRFELFPFGEDGFHDHDKLKNYRAHEHYPVDDFEITKKNIWSALMTFKELERVRGEILNKLADNTTLLEAKQQIIDGGIF